MAEILLKVGDTKHYKDGDIIATFSDLRIKYVHAQHICSVMNFGFKSNGLRPDFLTNHFKETFLQYRFDRINKTQIRSTNLRTGEQKIHGYPEIKVELYLQRRLKHHRHAIFGETGKEYWYGGTTRINPKAIFRIWRIIEQKSVFRESDHTLWPFGHLDLKHFLAIRTGFFTQERSVVLSSTMGDGDEDISHRRYSVDWREYFSAKDIADIHNPRCLFGEMKNNKLNKAFQLTSKTQQILPLSVIKENSTDKILTLNYANSY